MFKPFPFTQRLTTAASPASRTASPGSLDSGEFWRPRAPFLWFFTQFRGTPIPVGNGLLAMAASWLEYFIGGVHIHFCGNGLLWFRFYSGL
ncbi:hypothetical protein, partial [Pseudomonas sp. Root71]|uniref:hypothetical protein n=1 Tax=Pseudomonas sp. Root71 TaxID=1736593 RepID=UPI001F1923F6